MKIKFSIKGITMQLNTLRILTLLLFLTTHYAFSKQTYNLQHNQIQPEKTFKQPSVQQDAKVFIGCVEYTVSYVVSPTEDSERRDNAQFAATENKKSYGDKRTICYNANGDWVHIYGNSELVDKIWYFTDTNEEYTFFKTGILKFSLNDIPEPEGFTGLTIKDVIKTSETKKLLGFETVKVTAKIESGIVTNYWVSEKLVRNPASYKNNKFGYADKLFSAVRGIPLREETNVSDFLITVKEALNIKEGEPDEEIFMLPAVDLYEW
jgi:hypothetical protein